MFLEHLRFYTINYRGRLLEEGNQTPVVSALQQPAGQVLDINQFVWFVM